MMPYYCFIFARSILYKGNFSALQIIYCSKHLKPVLFFILSDLQAAFNRPAAMLYIETAGTVGILLLSNCLRNICCNLVNITAAVAV